MDDLGAMHAILSDPAAMRFWSTLPHASVEESGKWLASMVEVDPVTSDDFILEAGGQVIGKLGCWQLPEIGYLLSPSIWGRGYASEAMAAFLAHRRRLGSGHLTADTDPANTASIRLLDRHGFVQTGGHERTCLIGGI